MRNRLKRVVTIIITILLFVCGIHQVATAATWSGSGTEKNPYCISTESGLRQLATDVKNGNSYSGKYFLVTSDINLTKEWIPIGTSTTAFRGTFNGNGKTISNLTVTGDYTGLFAYVGSGATIKNINMTNVSVSGGQYIAGVVAYADTGTGTINITNCDVQGTLRDTNESYPDGYVAGIVGYANAEKGSMTISDCTMAGVVYCDYYSGGIVGYGKGTSYSLKLLNCTNNASISAGSNSNYCGGIAGYLEYAEVTSCVNFGDVYGNAYSEDNGSSWLGGITGSGYKIIFRGCANYGDISTFFAAGITPSQYGDHIADSCINAGKLYHSSDGYGTSFIYSGFIVNCHGSSSSGSVAHSLRKYFGQKIGVDANPVQLTDDNRVYKITIIGEVNKTYYANYGDTIQLPELSSCAAYFDGDTKAENSIVVTRDYAFAAKGYHKYADGICVYCGYEGATYKDLGSCGESAVWKLDNYGNLYIYGTGAMTDYSDSNPAPWSAYASEIKSVSVYDDVTDVGNYAFKDLVNVTSVNLSSSVATIGNYSFYGMTSLPQITFSNTITEIGEYAFGSCKGLTSISWGKQLDTIGNYAFYQCESLTSISIPSSVTTMGNGAFMKCTNLKYLSLENGLKKIGSYAFSEVGFTNLYIPATVEEIGEYVFKNCNDLTFVTFHGAAPKIAATAFYGDTTYCLTPDYDSSWDAVINKNYGGTLTWAIGYGTCGNDVNWILDYNKKLTISGSGTMTNFDTYYGDVRTPWSHIKEQIETVDICNGVTSIGDYAFAQCINMKSINIANSVTQIGRTGTYYYYGHCFMDCTSLTQITIPSSVTSIAYTAFYKCPNLTTIDVAYGNTAYSSADDILYNRYKNSLCCYPAGKEGAFVIPSSVKTIEPYAFTNCDGLTEITIPSSVTSIGEYAFNYCNGLKCITFTGNAPVIDDYAFFTDEADVYYPTSNSSWNSSMMKGYGGTLTWHAGTGSCGSSVNWELIYVNNSATLTISGTGAMDDYTADTLPWKDHIANIKTFVVNDGVTSVGAYALYNGTNLTKVTLANSVKSIGSDAFYGCSKLNTLTLGNGIKTIGDSAFCSTALTSIDFPDSLETIGKYSFYNCPSLKSITFGNSLKSIGYTAFGYCTALQKVDLGNSITALEQSAFNGCSKLIKIIIPASVTSVGTYVFRNCTNLQYVEFLGNAPTFNTDAFGGTTCNAYYHSSKSGWTSSKLQNYGGTVTWGAVSQRGTCGSNAEWILDTDGNLLICGSGSMTSYSEKTKAPWYDYRANIKKVTFKGVTSIGAYAFSGCNAIEEVSVSYAISSVGNYAFADCTDLQVVMFNGSAPSFGANSFSNVTCDMWYLSTNSWSSSVRKDYGGTLTWRSTTANGVCGTNVRWALDSSGTLVLLGSGDMKGYSSVSSQPWYSNRSSIKSVAVGGKVTSVGSYSFRNCTALQSVTIGENVTAVNNYAFAGCSALKTITFQGDAPTISSTAFNSVTSTAYYPIVKTTWTSSKKQNYGGTITWESVCFKHNETVASAVSATCTTDGLTEGVYCSICKEFLVPQEVIPAYGHYAIGPDNTEVPASSLDGDCLNPIICTVCNKVAIEAKGHRVLGTVPVEADPLTITNHTSYPFSLRDGTYYSTNKSNNSYSSLQITAKYDCTLTLNYGVSSEEDYDKFGIYLNGSTKAKISGEVTNQTMTLTLTAGDKVTVSYDKDESVNNGSDCGWVTLIYDPVMVDGVGDVPAETAEPTCTDAVVCKYCQTVVKEALGHRVILQQPEPENPIEVTNTSTTPFVLTDGTYYSENHTSSSVSELKIEVNGEGTLTLNYGVSSEPTYDKLIILLNGTSKDTISGTVSNKKLSFEVAVGDIIIVRYQKDGSINKNDDMGWVSVQYVSKPNQEIVPADAVEPGCNGVICDYCQVVVKEGLGHNWDEGVETVPATHLTEGVETFTCHCGESYTETIAKLEEHTYTSRVTKEPTHLEEGEITYTCECNDSYTETIEKLKEHSYEAVVTEPTCTSGGYTTYTCECGDAYVADEVSALGHSYENGVVTTEPTCTENGVKTFTCTACDDSYAEDVDALGHIEEDLVAVAPTCIETGLTEGVKCSVCDVIITEQEIVPATGHDFDYTMSEENLTRPTESLDGYYTFTCKNGCGVTETQTVKSADYSVYNEAEATIKGYLTNPDITDAAKQEIMDAIIQNAQNSDCFDENGNIRKDLIESEQHIVDTATSSAQELLDFIETKISNGEYTKPDYSEIDEKINEIDEILKDATISDEMKSELDDIKSELKELKNDEDASQSDVDGTLDSLMDRLDEITSTIANCANGNHSFTKYVITKDAECDVDGIKTAICDNGCGATDEEVIPAFGHSYVENVIAPTCTEDGYTEYNCSTCGDSYNDNVIIATGHSYTSEVTKVPTHTETGVRTYTCNCGHSYIETIEVTSDHTYVESITKEATCTSVGEITFVCICGSSYTEEISVLGHDYATDYTVDTEATCTTDGSKSQHCSRCDSTTNVTTIPAKGHNYSEWTLANEGTCTNPGQDMRSCLFCGDVQYRENSSKEHDYVSELIIVVEPTCTEQGYSTYVCAACDYRYVDDYTAPYGHNYIDGVCERCGEKDPSVPDEPEYNYAFSIQNPSRTEIRHKDGIKLHTNIEGNAPAGSYVKWTASNGKFKTEEINNGNSLKIVSDSNGKTTFTATLYSADGEILATDTIEMKSKAGFFDKIGSFFRSLFGTTKIYED